MPTNLGPDEPVADLVPSDLIRPNQAAKLLSMHLATIYRWMDEGRLAYWRVGRQKRVSRADVLAMAKRGMPRRPDVRPPETAEAVAARRAESKQTLERFGFGQ